MRKKIKCTLGLLMMRVFFITDLQACENDQVIRETRLYSPAQKLTDYEFSNLALKSQALQPREKAFERLEFLGDRVLGLVTAHLLYDHYPSKDSGWLAENFKIIVSKSSLVRMYSDLDIETAELTSQFYQAPIGRAISEKTASDIIEAFVGAIYIDSSFETIQAIGKQLIATHYDIELKRKHIDAKSTKSINLSLRVSKLRNQPSNLRLETLQNVISYYFNDITLLNDAFCHSSMGNKSFKRLDFLGVQVLALAVANHVFTTYPEYTEGLLTQTYMVIFNNNSMEDVFQNWQLWRYLKKQTSLISDILCPQRVAPSIAVSTVRSLLGAIYLDGGWSHAKITVNKLIFSSPSISSEKPKVIMPNRIFSNTDNDSTLEKRAEVESVPIQAIGNPIIKYEEWPSLVIKNDNYSLQTPNLQPQNQLNYKQALLKVNCSNNSIHFAGSVPIKREEWPVLSAKELGVNKKEKHYLVGEPIPPIYNQLTYKKILVQRLP